MKKKNMVALAGVAALAFIGGTLAYYNSTLAVTNKLSTKGYESQLIEKFTPKDDWQPGVAVDKVVQVKNTGDYAVLARVTYAEKWTGSDGTVKYSGDAAVDHKDNQDATEVTKNLNTEDWIYGDDGYYYYKEPVAAKTGISQPFLSTITMKSDIDITGTVEKTTYYSTKKAETATDLGDGDWLVLDAGAELPKDTTFTRVVEKSGKDSYANANYELVITAQMLQHTKEAVDAEENLSWKNGLTAAGLYDTFFPAQP